MRKNHVLLTMALAGVMTAGMAMTAFAGWVQTNGVWYFYNDSTGKMVTDDWATSGDNRYYLGRDGAMKTNSFIDDTYYVDGSGAMVKNSWQLISDDWGEEATWRYFGSNGKAYQDGMKQIDGVWYHFDDTEMSTGWIDEGDYTYYFKDSGAMATGWKWLADRDEDEWDEHWYYFTSAGKLVTKTEKKIDGVNYVFDDMGRMLTGWVNTSDYTSSGNNDLNSTDIDELRYIDDNGASVNGWMYLEAPEDTEYNWYYFKDGRAYSTNYKTTEVGEYGMAKINGEYYCFDENGRLQMGVVETAGKIFYFSESDGTMQTGRMTLYTDDYYDEVFYFATSGTIGERGAGVTGVKDGYLYKNGALVAADEGAKYALVVVDGDKYLVNESGKVKTSGTAKDADGTKYKVTKNSDGTYTITVTLDD